MIGVIIPAHNEQHLIGDCLTAIGFAARDPALAGERVVVVVCADACEDATEAIARRHRAAVVTVGSRNVGEARAYAASVALEHGARWIASTDADSCVPPNWLSAQLAHRTAAVCGTVRVTDWGSLGRRVIEHFFGSYRNVDGHRHIHGANIGVAREAYLAVGGFQSAVAHEDVNLIERLSHCGYRIAWSSSPCVTTCARLDPRAPQGFGATLLRSVDEVARCAT
jgi:cellulose synthase/poly-beta-1,6-N-acetylglucosamine synthase-like glycosyltransferase